MSVPLSARTVTSRGSIQPTAWSLTAPISKWKGKKKKFKPPSSCLLCHGNIRRNTFGNTEFETQGAVLVVVIAAVILSPGIKSPGLPVCLRAAVFGGNHRKVERGGAQLLYHQWGFRIFPPSLPFLSMPPPSFPKRLWLSPASLIYLVLSCSSPALLSPTGPTEQHPFAKPARLRMLPPLPSLSVLLLNEPR